MLRNLLVIFLSIVFSGICTAQKREIYQGVYIYQFSKYIKWPDNYNPETFVIGVVGDETGLKSMQTMANTKKETSGKQFVINMVSGINEIGNANILFVQQGFENVLPNIVNSTRNKPILIVTEGEGLIQKGAVISLVDIDGRMRFELSKSRAEEQGLIVSGTLASLAILK